MPSMERMTASGVLDPKELPPPPPLHLFSARNQKETDAVARQRYEAQWKKASAHLAALWKMEAQLNAAEAQRVSKSMPTSRWGWDVCWTQSIASVTFLNLFLDSPPCVKVHAAVPAAAPPQRAAAPTAAAPATAAYNAVPPPAEDPRAEAAVLTMPGISPPPPPVWPPQPILAKFGSGTYFFCGLCSVNAIMYCRDFTNFNPPPPARTWGSQ